jgi:hypothetical protein
MELFTQAEQAQLRLMVQVAVGQVLQEMGVTHQATQAVMVVLAAAAAAQVAALVLSAAQEFFTFSTRMELL